MASPEKFELRQQLSADHLMAVTNALDFKLAHLDKFLLEVAALAPPKSVYDKIGAEIQLLKDARGQVSRLFYDQFSEGRKMNDERGCLGLAAVAS